MLKKILLVIALVSMIAIVGCKKEEPAPTPPASEAPAMPGMPTDLQKQAGDAAKQAEQTAEGAKQEAGKAIENAGKELQK